MVLAVTGFGFALVLAAAFFGFGLTIFVESTAAGLVAADCAMATAGAPKRQHGAYAKESEATKNHVVLPENGLKDSRRRGHAEACPRPDCPYGIYKP